MKVAKVYLHCTFRFEVWCAVYDKQGQANYWKLFKESGWNKYRIPSTTNGVNFVLKDILVENPDYGVLNLFTKLTERETLKFIKDVEDLLAKH